MDTFTLKVRKGQVKDILAATFPDYRGRKFQIVFQESLRFYDTNWSGGSRNEYAFVAADGRTKHLAVPAPWDNVAEGQRVELTPNVLVVRHSHFCGKDMGITIYAHPCYLPKYLPEGR